MRVSLLSTGRADLGALKAVNAALRAVEIESTIYDVSGRPAYDTPASIAADAAYIARWAAMDVLSAETSDMALIVGDRYEALATATSAYLWGIPIAHLSGGDITEGSKDDSMRHAITKLAHLHFATNEASAQRIIQMGEEPWRVHTVGYPGADNLDMQMSKEEETLLKCLLPSTKQFLLVVWHPNTIFAHNMPSETDQLITALKEIHPTIGVILISPNNDTGNSYIQGAFEKLSEVRPNTNHVGTIARPVYLALLKRCAALVGNSSSGFYEAPSFGTHVINIGDRQKGRIAGDNVINSPALSSDIKQAVASVVGVTRKQVQNPYFKANAAEQIAAVIKSYEGKASLLLPRKVWHDVQSGVGKDPQKQKLGKVPKRGNGAMDDAALPTGPIQLSFWGEGS